jgi:hypothetical protein
VCEPIGAEGAIPFNFVNWAENYGINIPAGRYYATCSFTWYHPDVGDGSFAETSGLVYYEGSSTPVESFDINLDIDHNEETYIIDVWMVDPEFAPIPDTITISIYTEEDATDILVDSATYYDADSVCVDVRNIVSSLNNG